MNSLQKFTDIKHGFYINLANRPDRNNDAIGEFQKLGFVPQRFNAIKTVNGAIGCSASHMKCLSIAKKMEWDHVLICEDDICFTNVSQFRSQLDTFLKNHVGEWDVILLGGNNFRPYQLVDETCIKVQRCQTTTGYIVAKHYIPTLLENITDGLNKLMHNPYCGVIYAIDQFWFQLQEKDNWFLIAPHGAIQRPSYSDIERRNTDYRNVLTNVDKEVVWINGKRQLKINSI